MDPHPPLLPLAESHRHSLEALRPVPANDAEFVSFPEGAVVINLGTGYYYTLNPSASWLWERFDGIHSIAQIRADLVATFDAPAEHQRSDLLQLLSDLHAARLINLLPPVRTLPGQPVEGGPPQ